MSSTASAQKKDSDLLSLPGGHQIRRDQLRQLYENVGVKFGDDGKATLSLDDGSAIRSIEIDEDMLLQPKPADWKTFNDELTKALGTQVELFDPKDMAHEFVLAGNRARNMGRIWHHDEYVGFPPRLRRYYTYLTLEAVAELSNADWEQIGMYVACVVVAVGLTALLTLVPGGQVIIANFIGIVAIVAAGCLALVAGVGNQARNQAWVRKRIGR